MAIIIIIIIIITIIYWIGHLVYDIFSRFSYLSF